MTTWLGHFRRPPVESTRKLVREAPLDRLETGTRAVVEIVGYPDGQVRLATSTITGSRGDRQVVQRGVLMFVDEDEAKDALDELVDRVSAEARSPVPRAE